MPWERGKGGKEEGGKGERRRAEGGIAGREGPECGKGKLAKADIYFAEWVEALRSEKDVSRQLSGLGRALQSLEPSSERQEGRIAGTFRGPRSWLTETLLSLPLGTDGKDWQCHLGERQCITVSLSH